MIELTINGNKLSIENGTTVLDAASQLGISIPTMCHNGDLPHFTTCMICLVKDKSNGKLFTSCSVKATEGMEIITLDEEIREARKTALDLLLSDHVGDCEAPCQLSCPAHMDIPMMNHLLAAGKFEEAYDIVIQDIPLPSILGRICPAPCEGACRRKSVDEAVSICLLKRAAGDYVVGEEGPDISIRGQGGGPRVREDDNSPISVSAEGGGPRVSIRGQGRGPRVREDDNSPRVILTTADCQLPTANCPLPTANCPLPHVAVIGSGPHGLSAAWFLRSFGYHCTIFESSALPGGALRYSIPREKLPLDILEYEIERIRQSGVLFEMNSEITPARLVELQHQFDAVILPLDKAPKMAIKASALGKEAAWKVRQKLTGEPETGEPRQFNSRFGRLQEPEATEYLKESILGNRIEPAAGISEGMSREEVMNEAARCLHCECRKADNCLLRIHSHQYGAEQKRFQGPDRKLITKQFQHDIVVYEPQKCIKCSICIRITQKNQEALGLTFIGRGFDVVVGVPFSESIREGLTSTAEEAADACPTGALARKGGKVK